MPHETGHLPDRPEGDALGALESAACHLAGTPRPGGASALGSREIFRRRQERDLLAWAEKARRLISPATYQPALRPGDEEHRVSTPGDRSRYWKATHLGRCGFTVIVGEETGQQPDPTNALPLEYLERLRLQNSLFSDDIRLEGVAMENGQLVLVTSLPAILGGPVTQEGMLAFYRDLDEVAAFDAHPGNFVKDDNGVVLPIDLVLLRAEEELQKAF